MQIFNLSLTLETRGGLLGQGEISTPHLTEQPTLRLPWGCLPFQKGPAQPFPVPCVDETQAQG